jgi:GTP 3',8-cyclase
MRLLCGTGASGRIAHTPWRAAPGPGNRDAVPHSTAPVLAYVLSDALYLNVTSACTLACVFCPKIRDDDFTVGGYDLRLAHAPSEEEVWGAAQRAGLGARTEVVFTGFGEATRRLDLVLSLTRRLKEASVARVRLDTDGLASLREGRDVPPELRAAGLDAVSVSLNAADADTYAQLCPSRYGVAAYEAVKGFIRSAVGCLPEVSASAVAVPGLSEAECRSVAEGLGARFRWRPYNRLGPIAARAPAPQRI